MITSPERERRLTNCRRLRSGLVSLTASHMLDFDASFKIRCMFFLYASTPGWP